MVVIPYQKDSLLNIVGESIKEIQSLNFNTSLS